MRAVCEDCQRSYLGRSSALWVGLTYIWLGYTIDNLFP
jgi:hypothetical protein